MEFLPDNGDNRREQEKPCVNRRGVRRRSAR